MITALLIADAQRSRRNPEFYFFGDMILRLPIKELDFEFTPPLVWSIRSTNLPPLSSMVWKLDTLPPKHAAIDRPGTWAEKDKTRGQTCQHDRRSFKAG